MFSYPVGPLCSAELKLANLRDMISTSQLEKLPDVCGFKRITQTLAALDAVMSPDWEYRYYSFDSNWNNNEQMASMRNGSGDQWFSVICEMGVALHGLAHESEQFTPNLPKPWVFEHLPEIFTQSLLNETAFDTGNSTFCIWKLKNEGQWRSGVPVGGSGTDDGSGELLAILEGCPSQYVEFASEYYEQALHIDVVKLIYAHVPMTLEMKNEINPRANADQVRGDLLAIGYPCEW